MAERQIPENENRKGNIKGAWSDYFIRIFMVSFISVTLVGSSLSVPLLFSLSHFFSPWLVFTAYWPCTWFSQRCYVIPNIAMTYRFHILCWLTLVSCVSFQKGVRYQNSLVYKPKQRSAWLHLRSVDTKSVSCIEYGAGCVICKPASLRDCQSIRYKTPMYLFIVSWLFMTSVNNNYSALSSFWHIWWNFQLWIK